MGEMADYYTNEGLGTDEELEKMSDPELRLFFVCYANGNFHSSTSDQDIAWSTARRINGIFGELVNVQRPQYLEEIAPPELVVQIDEFLENPRSEVRRGRPLRKADIDDDQSVPALDQSNAA